jgi:uncharacterized integral membrane protein
MSNPIKKTNLTARQIINIVLLIILLIFIGQNIESARVKFLFFKFEIPLIILVFIVFFLGFYTSRVFVVTKKKKKENKTPEEIE